MPTNAPQLPPGLTPKPAPATREEEEAIVRKAYNDARMHIRNYKKSVAELGYQREAIAAGAAKLKAALAELDKADATLAAEQAKLDAQTKTLDDSLAELKKIVDGLDKRPNA